MSTKEYFDEAYDFNGEPEGHPNTRPGIRVHFIRWAMMPHFKGIANKLVEMFDWPRDAKILIVGGAFGWLTEILENEYDFINIQTLDTSPYVQENKDVSETAEINEAILKVGLDPVVGEGFHKKQLLCDGGPRCRTKRGIITDTDEQFELILTERVLSNLMDHEAKQLSVKYNKLTLTLVHLIQPLMPNQDQEGYNWKTAREWKVLLPNDNIIDSQSWEYW